MTCEKSTNELITLESFDNQKKTHNYEQIGKELKLARTQVAASSPMWWTNGWSVFICLLKVRALRSSQSTHQTKMTRESNVFMMSFVSLLRDTDHQSAIEATDVVGERLCQPIFVQCLRPYLQSERARTKEMGDHLHTVATEDTKESSNTKNSRRSA